MMRTRDWRAARDAGMSDIVGTMIMLGVTVSVIMLISVQTLGSITDESSYDPLDVVVAARPGDTELALMHAGGPTVEADDLRVVVSVRDTILYDGPLGPAGATWTLGEQMILPLSAALADGDDLTVSIVSIAKGETVASPGAHLPDSSAALPAGAFVIALAFDDAGADAVTVTPPRSLYVEAALLEHPQGRLAVPSVTIDLSELGGPRGVPLLDFGANGDALAADGIYSAYALVPVTATPGTYTVWARAVDMNGVEVLDSGTITVLPPGDGSGGTGDGGSGSDGGTGGTGSDGGTGGTGSDGGTGGTGSDGGTGGTGGSGSDGMDGNPNAPASALALKYNKSLIKAFSHRTLKFEAGSHDAISIHVKIQLVADPIWIWDVNSPSANKTDLYTLMPGVIGGGDPLSALRADYDWLKPGSTDPFTLSEGGTGGTTWFCRDASTQILGFRRDNMSVTSFEHERDTLWYYFGAAWQRLDATGNPVAGAFHRETISSGGPDEYFVIPRSTNSMVIKDGTFTSSFDNCAY